MSKKDYIKIAESMNMYLGLDTAKKNQKWRADQIVQALTNSLRGTNPRFDSGRFYRHTMQGCSDAQFERRAKERARQHKVELARRKAALKEAMQHNVSSPTS